MKTIDCKSCGSSVQVDDTIESVVCWECVAESLRDLEGPTKKKLVGYPKGWRFMKEFVHENGTVYHKGVEQPDLNGTLPPTPIVLKPKKTKQQRNEEKAQALAEYAQLKKLLKKETRKTYAKKLQSKLNKLQKLI
jgi:hypothetical protein